MTDLNKAREVAQRLRDDCYPVVDHDASEAADTIYTLVAEVERLTKVDVEPHKGCACRWDADDKRVATCVRHQGWLDVVQEWADRAKDAESALAALRKENEDHIQQLRKEQMTVQRLREALEKIAIDATNPYTDGWCGTLAYAALKGDV